MNMGCIRQFNGLLKRGLKMALRAVKPTSVEKRLKALFYGQAGAGKTTAAISFPSVYLIDTEKGSVNDSYCKILETGGGAVFHTADFDEVMTEVRSLLTERHEFKTLVIDPVTNIYDSLVEKMEKKHGVGFGKHIVEANKIMKHFIRMLLRLDMNVILTAHSKNEYGQNMSVMGQTFDAYKKLDYPFDLVFEIQKRGKDRVAIIKKTRLEEYFPEGDTFNFSYDEIAKRYGKKIIEKETVSEELASFEQVEKLTSLLDSLKIPEETVDKWLEKADACRLEDMTSSTIQKCIDALMSKLKQMQGE
jgi:hypothetical protein